MPEIRFTPNSEKIVNAMAFFAEKYPGSTKMKIFKLLYYADKEHLLRYGRPITGDRYIRMKWGPTPSQGYDMTKGQTSSKRMALFQSKLSMSGDSMRGLHSPDMKVFSRSDERILRETCERYGKYTAADLSKLSHKEPTWKKTAENKPIDFELMFEGRPDAEMTLELIKSELSSRPLEHAAAETA